MAVSYSGYARFNLTQGDFIGDRMATSGQYHRPVERRLVFAVISLSLMLPLVRKVTGCFYRTS